MEMVQDCIDVCGAHYHLVYNGTVVMAMAVNMILNAGQSLCKYCIPYVLYVCSAMESSISLLSVKFLKWRSTLYSLACSVLEDSKEYSAADTYLDECIGKVRALKDLEHSDGVPPTVEEDAILTDAENLLLRLRVRSDLTKGKKPTLKDLLKFVSVAYRESPRMYDEVAECLLHALKFVNLSIKDNDSSIMTAHIISLLKECFSNVVLDHSMTYSVIIKVMSLLFIRNYFNEYESLYAVVSPILSKQPDSDANSKRLALYLNVMHACCAKSSNSSALHEALSAVTQVMAVEGSEIIIRATTTLYNKCSESMKFMSFHPYVSLLKFVSKSFNLSPVEILKYGKSECTIEQLIGISCPASDLECDRLLLYHKLLMYAKCGDIRLRCNCARTVLLSMEHSGSFSNALAVAKEALEAIECSRLFRLKCAPTVTNSQLDSELACLNVEFLCHVIRLDLIVGAVSARKLAVNAALESLEGAMTRLNTKTKYLTIQEKQKDTDLLSKSITLVRDCEYKYGVINSLRVVLQQKSVCCHMLEIITQRELLFTCI